MSAIRNKSTKKKDTIEGLRSAAALALKYSNPIQLLQILENQVNEELN